MNITEKTTIPLFAVLASLPIVFGFIVWISFVASDTKANAMDITSVKQVAIEQNKVLMKIRDDVSYIRGKIDRK